jgi:hypothetical protein
MQICGESHYFAFKWSFLTPERSNKKVNGNLQFPPMVEQGRLSANSQIEWQEHR